MKRRKIKIKYIKIYKLFIKLQSSICIFYEHELRHLKKVLKDKLEEGFKTLLHVKMSKDIIKDNI